MSRINISVEDELREIGASEIVNRYVLWSMGSGLIPVPLLDIGAASVFQLRMLSRLAEHYDIPFLRNVGKKLIATFLGFISAQTLKRSFIGSFLKAVPGGAVMGVVSMPILLGASTYAIGKIFVQHFESGGTFLSLQPHRVKQHFSEYFEEGKAAAAELKKKSRS
jgi:uncharacterized protein (DUF697 family)